MKVERATVGRDVENERGEVVEGRGYHDDNVKVERGAVGRAAGSE